MGWELMLVHVLANCDNESRCFPADLKCRKLNLNPDW